MVILNGYHPHAGTTSSQKVEPRRNSRARMCGTEARHGCESTSGLDPNRLERSVQSYSFK